MMPPWLEALCSEKTADSKTASHPLAAVPIAGKLMAALDILRHGTLLPAGAQMTCARSLLPLVMAGTCKHLHIKALSCPALRNAVAQAMLVFMAACCSNRYLLLLMHAAYCLLSPQQRHVKIHTSSGCFRQGALQG